MRPLSCKCEDYGQNRSFSQTSGVTVRSQKVSQDNAIYRNRIKKRPRYPPQDISSRDIKSSPLILVGKFYQQKKKRGGGEQQFSFITLLLFSAKEPLNPEEESKPNVRKKGCCGPQNAYMSSPSICMWVLTLFF